MFQPIRDVGALKPPWTRRRGGEPDEIDEVRGGAAPVENLHEVRERIPAVVAGRGGVGLAPLAKVIVERGRVLRELQCAQVTEALDPQA